MTLFKNNRLGLLLSTVLGVTLSSCGNSPLFNHVNADEVRTDNNQDPANVCPIEFHQAKLCAGITWTKPASSDGEGAFTLQFWDSVARDPKGPYVDPTNTVAVQLWMPDMGHGSSPVTIQKSAVGVYEVTRVFFVMPGDWDIRFQLKDKTKVIEQVVLPISVK